MKFWTAVVFYILANACFAFSTPDSTINSAVKPPPAAIEKSAPAQKAKNIAPGKSAVIGEEDLLIDETEEKKNASVHESNQIQPAQPINIDTSSALKNTSRDSLQKASAQPAPATPATPQRTQQAVQTPAIVDTIGVKTAAEPEKPIQPVTVEPIHSINFAKNLKDYRSPKIAMLLSFLVPGLGQAYVKSYYKTALFVALEATAIGFSVAYNNKGKKQMDNAKSFADQNYDNDSLSLYYNGLFGLFLNQNNQNPDTAHDKISQVFPDTSFLKGSKFRWANYYSDIQSGSYVQGWKDCEPTQSQIFEAGGNPATFTGSHNTYKLDNTTGYLVYIVDQNGGDSTKTIFGYSVSQQHYNAMVSQANNYYKTSQGILLTLLLNHVISAVDALISAKAYNDALLGRESMWQHISIQQQLVDAGPSLSGGMVLRVQF